MGSDFFANSIFILPGHERLIATEFALGPLDKNLASILSLGGAGLAVALYNFSPYTLIELKTTLRPVYSFLIAFWNFDILLGRGILNVALG